MFSYRNIIYFRENYFSNCQFSTGSTVPKFWPETFIYVVAVNLNNFDPKTEKLIKQTEIDHLAPDQLGWNWKSSDEDEFPWTGSFREELSDSLPLSSAETVYMFYLNWQTFIQTSIMCNVNILSINYIAPLSSLSSHQRNFLLRQFPYQPRSQQTTGINQEDFWQLEIRGSTWLLCL